MNTTQTTAPEGAPALPDLHGGLLDEAALDRLFQDLGALAQLLGIAVKGGARDRAAYQRLSLDQALSLLRAREVRGLQLRYRFEGEEWWDTLMPARGGYRLVRICQERREES